MKLKVGFVATVLLAGAVLLPAVVRAQETRSPQGELIFLRDFGTDEVGYLAIPNVAPRAGIVLAHGKYGLNSDLRIACDELAAQGFIVLAVDLFNGRIPDGPEDLEEISENYNIKTTVDAIITGLNFFSLSPRFQMKKKILVGVGESARDVIAAARRDRSAAAITFLDPDVIPNRELLEELRVPVQAFISTERTLKADLANIQGQGDGVRLDIERMPQVLYDEPDRFGRQINDRVWQEAFAFWGEAPVPERSIADRLLESVF
jgi:hypothetical protein